MIVLKCDDRSSAALRGMSVCWQYASALRDVTVLMAITNGVGQADDPGTRRRRQPDRLR
jgi:hypothetical protein